VNFGILAVRGRLRDGILDVRVRRRVSEVCDTVCDIVAVVCRGVRGL
jgi:hypothetical protein